MQVQQAVFTSARTARMSGYHLVARSAGISEDLACRLSAWGPTHGSLLDESRDASSLSFFTPDDRWFVLARTVYGGPEYSQRGGRQIVTVLMVMDRQQLARYGNNPITVLRTAISLGYLRWIDGIAGRLPELSIPDEVPLSTAGIEPEAEDRQLAQDALACLARSDRVVLIGPINACRVLEAIFTSTDTSQRAALSFATLLRPSIHRPFRIQFLPTATPMYRRQLAGMGVECLTRSSQSCAARVY